MMRTQLLKKQTALLLSCAALLGTLTACKQKQVVLENGGADGQVIGSDQILNYTLPEKGEEIVLMTIRDYGDVKIKLFPEQCPKGVENFKKLVETGFYDELIFHRVVDGFVIQGGDPRGDGTGGVDAWGSQEGFAQTISPHLCHVTGALAYAIGQDKLNKSQFYIVTGEEVTPELFGVLRDQYGKTFTPEVEALYQQSGGQPFLDGGYEVFGQVFDGLDKCLEIQKVAVNSETSKPKSAVVIEKAVIAEYDGEPPHYLNAAGEELQIGSSGLNDEG